MHKFTLPGDSFYANWYGVICDASKNKVTYEKHIASIKPAFALFRTREKFY